MVENKVIIITGGAGLLGQEFVKSVLENKGIVIVADIDKISAEKVIEELTSSTGNPNAYYFNIDITNDMSINALIENVSGRFGKIDAWVNNAYPKIAKLGKETKREFSNSFFEFELN